MREERLLLDPSLEGAAAPMMGALLVELDGFATPLVGLCAGCWFVLAGHPGHRHRPGS